MVLPGGRGVNKPHKVDRNGLWRFPEESSLDMRRRPPGLSVGLAASLRSMPTALCCKVIQTLSAEADD